MKETKKILIIEDDPDVIDNIEDVLELKGYKVIAARSGKVGIKHAKANIPDLIICDIMMPGMDGYEVLDTLKNDPATYSIPFLFLSAKAEREDLRRGMDLGADDYITKPFENKDILSAVETRLKKHSKIEKLYSDKLDELRQNVTNALPHEMRTPLNSILGFTQIMKNSLNKLSKAEIEKMLDDIHDSGIRLLRLIVNYTYYISLTDKNEQAYIRKDSITKHVEVLINEQMYELAYKYGRADDLKYHIEDHPVAVEEKFFLKAVEELVDNAFKFSRAGENVAVKGIVSGKKYKLEVSNAGRGMTEKDIRKLGAFMQFDRNRFEQQGLGLGIALVKKIVDFFNGTFEVSGTPGKCITFTVTFPLAK